MNLVCSYFVLRCKFSAYVFGQLLDVLVFNRLRKLKTWWIAPTCSMVFGSLADTFLFFSVAFYASSDPFMAEHWFSLGLLIIYLNYLLVVLFFVPACNLWYLKRFYVKLML